MRESWEIHWKNYYKILQVDSSAEPEVIEKAFKTLAFKYHSDHNQGQNTDQRMKDINEAHDYLKDPEKRRRYHLAYTQKSSKPENNSNYGASPPPPPRPPLRPKPEVYPPLIRFSNVNPEEARKETFIIRNSGGPFSKVLLSNPSPWIRISRQIPMSANDKLPLTVEIEVKGEDWGKSYVDNIIIKLDDVETHVRVELQTMPKPNLPDVTPLTLSIETHNGLAKPIIEKNTLIPVSKSLIISTEKDNQTSIVIHVLQGLRPMAKDNRTLGRFILDGISPAPRGLPQIVVTFNIDINGILTVKAMDKGTGKEQKITITAFRGLKKEDIERMQQDSMAHAAEDAQTIAEHETVPKSARRGNKRKYFMGLLVSLSMFFLLSLITVFAYSYYSSRSVELAAILPVPTNPQPATILPVPTSTLQIPASPQPVKSIQIFRTLPFNVNQIIRQGETPDYVTIFLSPDLQTQPNTEYGMQLNYRDTGTLRDQIKAIWSSGDIQSKKQLPIFMKVKQDEINKYPIIAAYWDGVNISHQSQPFTVAYTFSLITINNLTEQQLVDQQNQQQQNQYQQQLAQYQLQLNNLAQQKQDINNQQDALYAQYQQQLFNVTQQKQDIKNQQDSLNAQYLQRLSDKKTQTNKILFIFISIDIILFLMILFFGYHYYVGNVKAHIGISRERQSGK